MLSLPCSRRSSVVLLALALALPAVSSQARELVEVVTDSGDRMVIEVMLDDVRARPVNVAGDLHHDIAISGEPSLQIAGAPALPSVTRSLLIPDDARMEAVVLEATYYELEDVALVPSKGVLPRSVDPLDVPYAFGPDYTTDAFFPGELVSLGAPYIQRDHRGVVLDVFPLQYNPVTRVLRVYELIRIEVFEAGPGEVNVLQGTGTRAESLAFHRLYRHRFLNFDDSRYPPASEDGDLLIICHDEWESNVEPLAEHKNSIGIDTTIVPVSAIGNDPPSLYGYILEQYENTDLAFVLLVGDSDHVATPQASGGASDPSYSKVSGNDDYPDLLIGRFSAESADHVDTQVNRTIEYEQMPATGQDWFRKGVGMGSNEGPGDDNEMDWEHIDVIRDDLLDYGYTEIDQLYDPGASAADLTEALNEGRGIVNYCGHGSIQSWVTTGFSNNHVASLENDSMLPFIHSVACNNGEFNHGTCFGEAWLRATNGGAPTGAIAVYMSSISQSWDPPMAAQDETVDLLVAEEYFSVGALFYAGSGLMMDEYGGDGVSMFDTWHLFGDPSLRVAGTAAPAVGLKVSPFDSLEAQGDAGGPFDPTEIVYTLENVGDYAIDFEVSRGVGWVSVSDTDGSLDPGETVEVTVSLNEDAEELIDDIYADEVFFTNTTDGEGDTTRDVTLQVGEPQLQYDWPLDEDPGWAVEGEWAFGQPSGDGGEHGNHDPTCGHTGDFVYGYNLFGDYPDDLSEKHLTTGPLDFTDVSQVTLKFWRWLGVEHSDYDHAYVRVSDDGETWTTVWENTDVVVDAYWSHEEIDLSAVADHQGEVYIRWTMGTTDGGVVFCGWNIDDVQLWGLGYASCWDEDADGYASTDCGEDDCDDTDDTIHPGADEICDDGLDNDCDGAVDVEDGDCVEIDDDDDDDTVGGEGGLVEIGAGCTCRQATTTRGLALPLLLVGFALVGRRRLRRG